MYFGHFAVATALKASKPNVPALPLFIGAGVIDIVNGLMIIGGADTVRGNLETLPYLYFDLVFIDWDHSLLMAAVWSGLFAWLCYHFYKSKNIAFWAFACSMLHWLADVPVHNQDLMCTSDCNSSTWNFHFQAALHVLSKAVIWL